MHNDDRELQIKLAELQTDVQINLTICVTLIAVFFASIISLQQLSIQASETWQKDIYLSAMIIMAVLALVVTWFYISKMKNKREEMEKLRKEFVW